MDNREIAPLTTEQAKLRLLDALDRCGPASWVRAHPWISVGAALVGGLVIGGARGNKDWLAAVIGSELALLMKHVLKQ